MRKYYLLVSLVLVFFALPKFIFAATLNFSPASGSYSVGDTMSVSVLVSSTNEAVNAFQGNISFPNNTLQVVSVSKANSIVKLWVQEPSYSNGAGTVLFEGVTPNPGYVGANGRIITITFRVKSAGPAVVKFTSGQVLANDGSGTDVLSGLSSAQFSLTEAHGTPIPKDPEPEPAIPSGPKITSLFVSVIKQDDPLSSRAKFKLAVLNKSAPIDHYEIQADGISLPLWVDDGSGIYETPPLSSGTHSISFKAVESTGKYYLATVSVTIIGIDPPLITEYQKKLSTLDLVIVRGTTKYPYHLVTVYFDKANGQRISQSITTDKDGKFSLVLDTKLEEGSYTIWADVTNPKGSKSGPSKEATVVVAESGLTKAGWTVIQVLSVILAVALLILFLGAVIVYMWAAGKRLRRRIRKDVHAIEDTIHESLEYMHKDFSVHLDKLEKARGTRKLSKEETEIFDSFEKHLMELDRFLKKEVHTVEKDIG